MTFVITACTNRKRKAPSEVLRASDLETGSLEGVARDWVARLNGATDLGAAGELYAGRSFVEAVAAAKAVDGQFAIVSAGLGLVTSEAQVPAYALSAVTGSSDSILSRIEANCTPQQWWAEISAGSPFCVRLAALISRSTGVVLVALSDTYLDMLAPELLALPPAELDRIRVVTRAPAQRVASKLRPLLMPYDDRLDGPDSPIKGTRGDFAQRAARHFAENILKAAPVATAAAHAEAVRETLSTWSEPPVFERRRFDDESLLVIIQEHWDRADGQSTKLLRVLRDDLNIACEQGRFVSLIKRLREIRQVAA